MPTLLPRSPATRPPGRGWRPVAVAVAVAVAVSASVAGCGGAHHGAAGTGASGGPRAAGTIAVTNTACAPSWSAPKAGLARFQVRDDATPAERVSLVDAASGGIYGQLSLLAPGTTSPLDAVLPAGTYRWRCTPLAGSATASAPATVRGRTSLRAHPLYPLSSDEINNAVDDYRRSVTAGLTRLVTATGRLRATVERGDLAAARTDWLAAHLAYERLGAAYGTFGDLADQLDGRPDGLAGGVADRDFTGFLRLEYGLWHGQSAAVLRPVARALDDAAQTLARTFPARPTNPADLPLRAHEILENTLQFQLTGASDEGAHTTLATARANVDGTRMVLAALRNPLARRDPALLAAAGTGLDALAGRLDRLQAAHGRWPAPADLSSAQREGLDAALGALLETLAPVPDLLAMPPSTAPS